MSRWTNASPRRRRYQWPLGRGTGGPSGGGSGDFVHAPQVPPCLTFTDLEILGLVLPARLVTLRSTGLLINAIATLVAVAFLADALPTLAHQVRTERKARAHAEIEAFLASLTPDEKARLYRALSSTSAISVLTRGNDADDDPALEKFRLFWGPFQSVRKQAELWGSALRSVSSTAKAGEVWVALIVLGVVAMSSLALRAHGLRLGKHGGD